MAGRGPQPKDASKRARANKDPIAIRILPAILTSQPELPEFFVETDNGVEPFRWPEITREWWQMWADSPLSVGFTSTDWSELRDTAMLHARYWLGQTSLASELRLRTAKFGATPEDRARLRIQFATADEVEDRARTRRTPARYKGLTASDAVEA